MKKKLRYAIGEILIVIVGITIAFSLNKYAEKAKDSREKQQYIINIIKDIESDKNQLETNSEQINNKIDKSTQIIPVLGTNAADKGEKLKGLFEIANLTNFTPKDFTYNALVNSGDLKLINNINIKTAIEKHYAEYKDLLQAYERQEIINKDYLGNYFIYQTDYDLIHEGKSPFKDEKLLKNIIQSIRGSLIIKKTATEKGISSCDTILKILTNY